MPRVLLSVLAAFILATFSTNRTHAADAKSKEPTFERGVRAILKAHCFQCHGEGEELEGGLDLRLRRLMTKGGESGPTIVPGKPANSLLLKRILSGDMPPGEKTLKLTKQEIATITRWVAGGAKTERPEPETIGKGLQVTDHDREFWSFRPIQRPTVPTVKNADRVRTPIDAFLLAKLEAKGFSFSADADKRTLIRRVYFDLLGLPPSAEEIEQFLSDKSPQAYERLVDRLLDSPHYGERWGRHWLDVAGYADSEGFTNDDTPRSWTYRYRDYVIRAFNADKPFDVFIREQLAGDEMVKPPYKELTPDKAELLIATGFLRMAPDGTGSGGVEQNVARNQVMADTVQIVGTSLLGLTVNCAQCHEHRYDPIPQADYYRFRAIFEPGYDWKNWRTPKQRLITLYTDADRKKAAEIEVEAKKIDAERLKKQQEYIDRTFEKELAKLAEELREPIRVARKTPAKKRTPEQKLLLKDNPSVNVSAGSLYLYDRKAADELKKIAAKATKLRGTKPKEEFLRALTETPGKVPTTFRFHRGDHEQPKEELSPAGLTALYASAGEAAIATQDKSMPTTGRRLAYARRLTSGSHPLLARVLVNRFWLNHFGKGIVETPGDFGALGTRPTHPELLDWLANRFMDDRWSLKRFHRLVMNSTVYRQAVRNDAKQDEVDPDNQLYGGKPLRRLEAEIIRDAVLTLSGKLNRKRFGAPVPVMADRVGQWVIGKENLNAGRPGAVIAMKGEEFRRSIYVQVRRSRPLAVLDTFDLPVMTPNCDQRASSTVATQSLMLMNSGFISGQSQFFAQRVQEQAGADLKKQVAMAWELTFSREATSEEVEEAARFLGEQAAHFRKANSSAKPPAKGKAPAKPSPELLALASLCQTLISSNAFLYVD
jgi:mono/diheme cytochrome c family protein